MKFSIKDFFSKYEQFTADLVAFTRAILKGKLHFFYAVQVKNKHWKLLNIKIRT